MIQPCLKCGDAKLLPPHKRKAAEFQDRKYGKGMRVINPKQSKNTAGGSSGGRCTVCGG